ncbi:MAG TPA: GNVR domain-containing protein, partial [Candidatus Acidoferrum sp.]|nr:GNVR domain-containing protein [Candidatus Acidoferrum sp.]
ALLIPTRYEAKTALMPPGDSDWGLASVLGAMTRGGGFGMAGDFLGLKTSGSLFIGILRSRTVEDRIIDNFDLRQIYHAQKMQDARRALEANTQISEDRKSGIITIGVSDHSPQRAADLAQAYVQELNHMVAEVNTSAAHRERVFLEERLKAVKLDLDSAAKDFSEFASKNGTIDIKEQGHAMVGAAAVLQGQLIAAQAELEGLRQIYSDENVRVKAVRAKVAELQKKLNEIGGSGLDTASSKNDASQSQFPSIRKLPLLGVTYSDLYRRTTIQETLFEVLTQQYELAKVQEVKETPSVKVLDGAIVPERKSFPPRSVIVLLGTFFAFAVGVLWVLARASWKETDERDPFKLLLSETYQEIETRVRAHAPNGWRLRRVR